MARTRNHSNHRQFIALLITTTTVTSATKFDVIVRTSSCKASSIFIRCQRVIESQFLNMNFSCKFVRWESNSPTKTDRQTYRRMDGHKDVFFENAPRMLLSECINEQNYCFYRPITLRSKKMSNKRTNASHSVLSHHGLNTSTDVFLCIREYVDPSGWMECLLRGSLTLAGTFSLHPTYPLSFSYNPSY